MEDWYEISYSNFVDNGGERLISIYKNSPTQAVMSIYLLYFTFKFI